MLQDHLSEGLRLLDLGRLIAGSADADPDIAVALQDIERAADAVSRPKGFVSKTCDLFRRRRLLLFLASFVLVLVARLLGILLTMERFFPELLRIARARAVASLHHCQADRIGECWQREVAL